MKTRRAGAPRWLIVVAWAMVAHAWIKSGVAPIVAGAVAVDFRAYYTAAERVAHGMSPYEGQGRFIYVYPSFTAAALAPFTRWTADQVQTGWRVMSLACAVLIVMMAVRLRPREGAEVDETGVAARSAPPTLEEHGEWEERSAPRQALDSGVAAPAAPPTLHFPIREAVANHWLLVCALVVGWFSPGFSHVMRVGQIELVIGALMCAMTLALLGGRDAWAGAALAPALLIKPTALPVLVLAAMWRRPRMIVAGLAGLVVYGIALAAFGLWPMEAQFWREIAPDLAWEKREISHSLARALAPESRFWFGVFAGIVTLSLGLLYLAVMIRMRQRGLEIARAIEFTLIAAPLISPLFEPHHLTMALPALFLQIRRWAEGGMGRLTARWVALGWGLVFPFSLYYEFLSRESLRVSYYLTTIGGFVVATAVAVEAMWGSQDIGRSANQSDVIEANQ